MGGTTRLAAAPAIILALATLPAAAQGGDCSTAAATCADRIAPSCLSRVGAGAFAAAPSIEPQSDAAADCQRQFTAYRSCLADFAQQCGGAPAAQNQAPAPNFSGDGLTMTTVWDAIKDSDNLAALESFANTYPGTPLAALAQSRAAELRDAAAEAEQARAARSPAPPPTDRRVGAGAAMMAPGVDQVQLTAQQIFQRYAFCLDSRGDPNSTMMVGSALLLNLADPMRDMKMMHQGIIDDAALFHIANASQGENACVATAVAEVSELSPEIATAFAQSLQAGEEALFEMILQRPIIGAVNRRLYDMMIASSQSFLNAVTAAQGRMMRLGGVTQDEMQDLRGETKAAFDAWSDARANVLGVFPAYIFPKPQDVMRCDWADDVLRCE